MLTFDSSLPPRGGNLLRRSRVLTGSRDCPTHLHCAPDSLNDLQFVVGPTAFGRSAPEKRRGIEGGGSPEAAGLGLRFPTLSAMRLRKEWGTHFQWSGKGGPPACSPKKRAKNAAMSTTLIYFRPVLASFLHQKRCFPSLFAVEIFPMNLYNAFRLNMLQRKKRRKSEFIP
jgi:hypothetical protein